MDNLRGQWYQAAMPILLRSLISSSLFYSLFAVAICQTPAFDEGQRIGIIVDLIAPGADTESIRRGPDLKRLVDSGEVDKSYWISATSASELKLELSKLVLGPEDRVSRLFIENVPAQRREYMFNRSKSSESAKTLATQVGPLVLNLVPDHAAPVSVDDFALAFVSLRGRYAADAMIYINAPSVVPAKKRLAREYASRLNEVFELGTGRIFVYSSRLRNAPSVAALMKPFWRDDAELSRGMRLAVQAGFLGLAVINVFLYVNNHVMEAAFLDGAVKVASELPLLRYNWGFEYKFKANGKTRLKRRRRTAMEQKMFAPKSYVQWACERVLTVFEKPVLD